MIASMNAFITYTVLPCVCCAIWPSLCQCALHTGTERVVVGGYINAGMKTARRRGETSFQFVKFSDLLQLHPFLTGCSRVCGLGQEDHGSHRTGRRLTGEQGQEKHDKCCNLQSPVLCTVYTVILTCMRVRRGTTSFVHVLRILLWQESSHQKSYVEWAFCSFYSLFVPHLAT